MESETQGLLDCLDNQRAHVLGILEGLTDGELRQSMLPSGWAILGLVQHLALDVERFWFREVVAGEILPEPDNASGSAWELSPTTRAESVLDSYRQEIKRANVIVASTPLNAEPKMWPDFFGDWRLGDLRAVLLHVIAETACHAGHLDAARELIDGRTWLKLP
ncbi:MAG TPA: DinB family protein [Acidimicrobiales bacterium]